MSTGLSHQMLPWIQWGAVLGASLIAAVIDLRSRRIPNWLTGPLLLGGLAWAGCSGGWSGIANALGAMVLLALPYVVLFVVAGGGAADAKLMGALGAWLGLSSGVPVLVAVCVSGAVLGIGYAVVKREARGVLCNMVLICYALVPALIGRRKWREAAELLPDSQNMLKIPYGLAIFAGVCFAAVSLYARKTGS